MVYVAVETLSDWVIGSLSHLKQVFQSLNRKSPNHQILLAFPHERVKHAINAETELLIKVHRPHVGLSNRQ